MGKTKRATPEEDFQVDADLHGQELGARYCTLCRRDDVQIARAIKDAEDRARDKERERCLKALRNGQDKEEAIWDIEDGVEPA